MGRKRTLSLAVACTDRFVAEEERLRRERNAARVLVKGFFFLLSEESAVPRME